MHRRLCLVLCIAACAGDPPPVEVSAGRLTARIYPDPAQIALVLDDQVVWTTRAGAGHSDSGTPDGFAATGSIAATVEMEFGAFRFTETPASETWQRIDHLTSIVATESGATFELYAGANRRGTGSLTFVAATRSGPDPDAAGFPRHVRIELDSAPAERLQIATPCATDEHLVGLGGQSFEVDHRGETVPLWVQEDGIGKFPDRDDQYLGVWFFTGRRHTTHTPMPMVLSSKGYALAVDTDARAVFDLAGEHEDVARFEAWDHHLAVNVFVGDGPRDGGIEGAAARDAFGHMIAWVGKPARPPQLVFAPWVDALYGSTNVRRVAQALRTNGIASSVIWSEDWRGGGDTATGYALHENWRVDRTLYPDFEQLATDLHGLGFAFHTYQNTFLDSSADVYSEATGPGYAIQGAGGAPYLFNGITFNPSTLLDLSNPSAVAWAKSVMTEAFTLGADGWMADFGEWLPTDAVLASGERALSVHNRYTVDWARMNHEMVSAPASGRPAQVYFMRSAWLHSQPNAMVMWAGDQQTDWSDGDGLPSVIPIGLGLGLAGFPYFGHDIGGYMSQGTVPTSAELFYRWTSFGALSPVMRTHHGRSARDNVQWEHDAGTIAHFRRWSRIHMQLAPYLWGSIGSYERDGLPLFRMIALEYPDEPWAWTTIDEYLLGDRILVAPVQVEGATTRSVQLPAGTWYPLLGGAPVTGPTTAADAPITELPAYVPAGAILVLYPDGVDTVLPAPAAPSAVTASAVGGDREVWLFSGTDAARGTWHDDDGPTGTPQWTWSGRAVAALPATATFDGAPVGVVIAGGVATVTVTGDGTLAFADGSTLVIARGLPAASAVVRLR